MLHRIAIAAVLFLLCATAMGQQSVAPGATALEAEPVEPVRRYSVELIIFEYTDPSSAGTEIFDPEEPSTVPGDDLYSDDLLHDESMDFDPLRADESERSMSAETDDISIADDSQDLLPATVDEKLEMVPTYEQAGLELLGPEDYVLNNAYERLERLGAYRPLMRAAWVQPTLEKDLTVPIKLRRLGNPPLRLDGTVMLYLSRYLHLVVDLALEEKAPLRVPAASGRLRQFGDQRSRFGIGPEFITPSTYYRIEEDRIVKNGDLRYFDHPRFGVLAKITRVEDDNAGENATDQFATPIAGAN